MSNSRNLADFGNSIEADGGLLTAELSGTTTFKSGSTTMLTIEDGAGLTIVNSPTWAMTVGTNNSELLIKAGGSNDIRFRTNDEDRMYIKNDGDVGIGTTPDTKLHVNGSIMSGSGSSVGGADTLIARYSDGSNDQPNIIGTSRSSAAWYICYGLRPSTATVDTFTSSVDNASWYRGAFRVGGDYAAFRSNGGSAVNTAVGTIIATNEYVRMDHMGISFNGDTAAANHLDDYEEGTFTPSFTTGGTLTVNSATYTKIGRQVTCRFHLTASTTCTGDITGLPFTPNGESGGVVGYQTHVASETIGILVQAANVWNLRIGQTQYGLAAGKQIRGMFSYFTDS